MKTIPVRYRIRPANPAAHRFDVECTVAASDPAGQRFSLPAWIPGSYLIRDFARHIVAIRAETGGKDVPLVKLDKHTWQAAALKPGTPLTVTCEVHAWDLSVRGAHLDETHAFFNGTSVFLRVVGQEEAPCLVDIQPPAGRTYRDWRVATALAPAHGETGAAAEHAFGLYRAANYDELIDHPVEMGTFTLARFTAAGVPHDIAISGRHDADLQRICAWQIALFGEPAPMPHYTFLVSAVGDGYGGLEHRASTALLCSRNDLPYAGMKGISESYRNFLGLCCHEYFHTWNVKRIKPAAFEHVAAHDGRHAGRRVGKDQVARRQLDELRQAGDDFGHFPGHLCQIAALAQFAVHGEPDAALGRMLEHARRRDGADRPALVEALAHVPRLPLFLGARLQVAARQVEADGVTENVLERLVDRDIGAALAERDDQLDFRPSSAGRRRHRRREPARRPAC